MTQKRNRNPSVESRNSFQWRIHLCSALNSRRLSRFLNVACLCFFVTLPQCFHFFSFSQKVNYIFSFSLSAPLSPRLNVFTFSQPGGSIFSFSQKGNRIFSFSQSSNSIFHFSWTSNKLNRDIRHICLHPTNRVSERQLKCSCQVIWIWILGVWLDS